MKADRIRTSLARYLRPQNDRILLEVIEGKPYSSEGGLWIEATVEDMERVTEDPAFDRKSSGWAKYLDKWHQEGLTSEKEMRTGKS